MDKTAVVILHFGSPKDTFDCLNSLLRSEVKKKSPQIIVVDNSLSEDLNNIIKEKYPEVELISQTKNLGFAQGVNIGVKRALELGKGYIVILNNDTILAKDAILKLVAFAQTDNRIGIISPKIYFAKGYEYHKTRYKGGEKGKVFWYAGGIIDWKNIYVHHRGIDEVDKGQYNEISNTDFATGCCMLITKEAIAKIGFFEEKYFLYFEDIDFSQRAKEKGLKVIYFPRAFLWHKNASSSGKPGSPLHVYYQTRNRLYFGFKYARFRAKKSLLLESFRFFLKGGIYRRAVYDYYLGQMGKGSL